MTFVATSLISPSKSPIDDHGKTQTLSSAQKMGIAADVVIGGTVLAFALLVILQTGGLVSLGPLAGIGTVGNTAALAMAGGVGVVVVSDATTLSVTLVRQVKKAEVQVAHIRMEKQKLNPPPGNPLINPDVSPSNTRSNPNLSGSFVFPRKEEPSLIPQPESNIIRRAHTEPPPKKNPPPSASPKFVLHHLNNDNTQGFPNSPGLSPILPKGKGSPVPIPKELPKNGNQSPHSPGANFSSKLPTTPSGLVSTFLNSPNSLSTTLLIEKSPPSQPPMSPSQYSLPPPPLSFSPLPNSPLSSPSPPSQEPNNLPLTPSRFPSPVSLPQPTFLPSPKKSVIPTGARNIITPDSVSKGHEQLVNYEKLFTEEFLKGKFKRQINAVLPLIISDTSRKVLEQAFDGFLTYLSGKGDQINEGVRNFAQNGFNDSFHALGEIQEDSSLFDDSDLSIPCEQLSFVEPVEDQMDVSFDSAPGELEKLFSYLYEYIKGKNEKDRSYAIKGCIALITDTLLKKVEEENTRAKESQKERLEHNQVRLVAEAEKAEKAKKSEILRAREQYMKWYAHDLTKLQVPDSAKIRLQTERPTNQNLLLPSEANELVRTLTKVHSEIGEKQTSEEMESLLEKLKSAGEKLRNFLNTIDRLGGKKIKMDDWFQES
ncbi:MAG: hypothetical protein K940chlam9_01196 [Chlamydiae bacterium]|nr:hypothetical protein [Chlamydiota bacterium]